MKYHLRRAASVLVAMTILVGLPVAGGAWLSGGVPVEPVEPVEAVEAGDQPWATIPENPATSTFGTSTDTPDPAAAGSVTEWVCEVDDSNDRCLPEKMAAAILAAAGGDVGEEADSNPGSALAEAGPEPVSSAVADAFEAVLPSAPDFDRLIPLDPGSAEDWRPLVEVFFDPDDVDRAVRVIECESHGNPTAKNPRSTASGLFQHLASYWPERSVKAGYAGTDVFEPVANVAVAAWLVYDGGGWSHWNPSKGCWS